MATLNATNLKHASSGSNNIVLAADGSTTISNLSNAGKILQVVSTNVTTTSSVSFGDQVLAATPATVTITSTALNSKFIISGQITGESNATDHSIGFVLRRVIGGSGSSLNIGTGAGSRSAISFTHATGYFNSDQLSTPSTSILSPYLDSPSQASGTAITYKIDIMGTGDSGTYYFGRTVQDQDNSAYERLPNYITVMEVAP